MFAHAAASMARGVLLSLIVILAVAVPALIKMDRGLPWLDEPQAPLPASPVAARPQKPKPKPDPKPAATTQDFQIAAGSVVAITLRTTVGSATSATGDQVDAELAESVIRDGMELIPAGSTMRGSVIDAMRASREALRGRIAIAFFVIEHVRTGSRAAIKSRPIVVDASQPADKLPLDVQLSAGHRLNVILAEPLLVRIPK